MSQVDLVLILFGIVVLLFSLSLHEAAHAWMASRLGDQTARMLGRITLNPIKHIDPLGTLLIPIVAAFSHFPLIGWAKPTPVNTRNFKNYVRDDILTTLAGPCSNILAAIAAFFVLVVLAKTSAAGADVVHGVAMRAIDLNASPVLLPIVLLCYMVLQINLFLFAFNILPLPPLDGSHVVRHMLPYNMLRIYDRAGVFSLILMMLFGGHWVQLIAGPILLTLRQILVSL